MSVGILNDDVLFSVFDFCRLTDEEKNGSDDVRFEVESAFNDQWNRGTLRGTGTSNVGGTSLRRFAKDGCLLSLPRPFD